MSKQNCVSPESPIAVRHTLDEIVDDHCKQFHDAWVKNAPFSINPETGELLQDEIDAADEALIQLVFVADARAQADNDEYSIVSNIAWAGVARQGMIRLSHRLGVASLHKLRVIVGSDMAIQEGAYKDMADRRVMASGSSVCDCTGLEYAVKVATGGILLEERR